MNITNGDLILISGNINISEVESCNAPIFIRISPILKGKASKNCSFVCSEPLNTSSTYADLIDLIELEYNALGNDENAERPVYKIDVDSAFNGCIYSIKGGLSFDIGANVHYIDDDMINDIIVVSQESMTYSIGKKTTEWIQIHNDALFKSVISHSASQIYSPQTKRPTQRDSAKAIEKYETRLKNELSNPKVKDLKYILLDLKVNFRIQRKRSLDNTKTNKAIDPLTTLRVDIGNTVVNEKGQLNTASTLMFHSYTITLPTIIESFGEYSTDPPYAFTLDMFRTRLFSEIVESQKCKAILTQIGIKSPMFCRTSCNRCSVTDNDFISTTSGLLKLINSAPRKSTEGNITVSFGTKLSSDSCITLHNNKYIISLLRQHDCNTALLEESVGLDRTDTLLDQLYYSQGDSRESSKNMKINESGDKINNKDLAVASRTSSSRAFVLLNELYSNSHQSNPYYYAFTDKIANEWARYLTQDTHGKDCLKQIDLSFSFDSGFVVIPDSFLPYHYKVNDDWTSNSIWTSKLGSGPYKPIRNAYPPVNNQEFPPHPKCKELANNLDTVLGDLGKAMLKRFEPNQKETNNNHAESYARYISFTRTENQIFDGISVKVNPQNTLLDHLMEACQIDKELKAKYKDDTMEFSLTTSLKNSSGSIRFSKDISKTITLNEILKNDTINQPIMFNIVGKKIYIDDGLDMF